jgi:hypothetical protein
MKKVIIHEIDCIYEKMNDAFDKLNYYLQKYKETDNIISDLHITSNEINGKILYGFSFKVNNNKPYIYIEI